MDYIIKDANLTSNVSIKNNEPLSAHTTMKVGGEAKVFIEVDSVQRIIDVVKYAKENNIDYCIIGNGSNLIFTDKGFDGIVLKVGSAFSDIDRLDETRIKVSGGFQLIKLSYYAKENGLSGMEFAAGIPGTIGGAVRMNAGAYGSEMINVVESVEYLDTNTFEIHKITNKECEFSYRHSMFVEHPEYVVVFATVKLEKGNIDEIEAKMEENNASRREKQPIEFPSSGSTFKRGADYIAAKLIDEAGLKGYRIGGAEVSTKHAGFVINTGDATATDVINLIEHIKNVVYEKFGVMLQEEVVTLGGK